MRRIRTERDDTLDLLNDLIDNWKEEEIDFLVESLKIRVRKT